MTNDVHDSFLSDDEDASSDQADPAPPLQQPGEEIAFEDYGFSITKTLFKIAPYLLAVFLLLSLLVGGWYTVTSPQGAHCDSPLDCRSGMCLTSSINNEHAFCADTCYTDKECPEAHLCLAQAGERVCVPEPSLDHGATCHFSFECKSQECLVEGTRSGGYQPYGLGYNPTFPTVTYASHGTCVEAGTLEKRQAQQREADEARRKLEDQLQQMRRMYSPGTF